MCRYSLAVTFSWMVIKWDLQNTLTWLLKQEETSPMVHSWYKSVLIIGMGWCRPQVNSEWSYGQGEGILLNCVPLVSSSILISVALLSPLSEIQDVPKHTLEYSRYGVPFLLFCANRVWDTGNQLRSNISSCVFYFFNFNILQCSSVSVTLFWLTSTLVFIIWCFSGSTIYTNDHGYGTLPFKK